MEWATGTTGKSIGLRELLCDFHATALEDAETLFSTRLAEPWGLSLGFRRVRVQFGTTSLSCCFHQIRALVWPVRRGTSSASYRARAMEQLQAVLAELSSL